MILVMICLVTACMQERLSAGTVSFLDEFTLTNRFFVLELIRFNLLLTNNKYQASRKYFQTVKLKLESSYMFWEMFLS